MKHYIQKNSDEHFINIQIALFFPMIARRIWFLSFLIICLSNVNIFLFFSILASPSRPPTVSEELFLTLRAFFESQVIRGKDFRAEFDRYDEAFTGE